MKKISIVCSLALSLGALCASAATVSAVSVNQGSDLGVTVSYTIDGPAVVTMDVKTNTTVSLGAALSRLTGDVNRRIPAAGTYQIRWQPEGPVDVAALKFEVVAWPLDDPPDYMVLDLNTNTTDRIRYYPSAGQLPGGLLENKDYRTTRLVMRKIPAKGITWMMGATTNEAQSIVAEEGAHTVTFSANYYMSVFELTQRQWECVAGQYRSWPSYFSNKDVRDMRPLENVCYNEVRTYAIVNSTAQEVSGSSATVDSQYLYPGAPHPSSFLGRLRTFFGGEIAFDLPSEAQWEWACRGGYGRTFWNDGSSIISIDHDTNLDRLARYKWTTASNADQYDGIDVTTCGEDDGTAIVGSYEPNGFGLYDMHGNVAEYCLDFKTSDISALNGAPNANGTQLASNPGTAGGMRVVRGGFWAYPAHPARSGRRLAEWPNVRRGKSGTSPAAYGIRLCCPASLQ